MIIAKDHILIRSTNYMRKLCKPLFEKTPIKYFEYVREFFGGGAMKLDTHDALLPYLIENNISLSSSAVNFTYRILFLSSADTEFRLYPADQQCVLVAMRDHFDLDHMLILPKKHDDKFMRLLNKIGRKRLQLI